MRLLIADIILIFTKVKEICKIKTGDYAGYSYIGIDKKRYYIKNL